MTLDDQIAALLRRQGASAAEEDLLTAEVVEHEPLEDAGANSTAYVRLATGTEAFHKPFSGVAPSTALMYGHEPARMVAVCVLRTVDGEAGSLSLRKPGEPDLDDDLAPAAPGAAAAAAFFDSLVAQQDRHFGNLLWDPDEGLGLIDHGYCLAASRAHLNAAAFVRWRWDEGREALTEWEAGALRGLLATAELHGLASILPADRAAALAARAERMLQTAAILHPGDF